LGTGCRRKEESESYRERLRLFIDDREEWRSPCGDESSARRTCLAAALSRPGMSWRNLNR
jgi:proline racemase